MKWTNIVVEHSTGNVAKLTCHGKVSTTVGAFDDGDCHEEVAL